ncbi:hypothetical protein HDU79_010534 [Rhizoclosmatium sp. JEL0117]|nr:hypothetical protein HDU79_010534 [Rhizoclosmatium sp. JEL0117]
MSTVTEDKIELPSVWRALDTLQLCYTVIPQMKHYYRYGTFRDCAQARRDLTFAMSLKSKSEEEAMAIVRERDETHYRTKITERSSIGVWTVGVSLSLPDFSHTLHVAAIGTACQLPPEAK